MPVAQSYVIPLNKKRKPKIVVSDATVNRGFKAARNADDRKKGVASPVKRLTIFPGKKKKRI